MGYKLWQRLAAEVLGTAFLVFVGAGSVPALVAARGGEPFTGPDLGFIALAFGLVVAVTVYVFGHISGNHINPAVTLALAATGKFPWREVPAYLVAQLVGAVVAAFGIVAVLGTVAAEPSTGNLGIVAYADNVGIAQAFTAEVIGTFILVVGVFGAIHAKAPAGFAGLAIGFVVFAAIIPVGPVTGAAINPARYTGPMLVGELYGSEVLWDQWLVYVIAQVVGAVLAGLVYVAISTERTQAAERATAGRTERV